MKSTMLKCDGCSNTAMEPRFGQRPEGWFLVIHDGPMEHYCSVGCLSRRYHPTIHIDLPATAR